MQIDLAPRNPDNIIFDCSLVIPVRIMDIGITNAPNTIQKELKDIVRMHVNRYKCFKSSGHHHNIN